MKQKTKNRIKIVALFCIVLVGVILIDFIREYHIQLWLTNSGKEPVAVGTYEKDGSIKGTLRDDFNAKFTHFGPQTCAEVIHWLQAYPGVIDIEPDSLILESYPPGYTWHVTFYNDERVIQSGTLGATCYETKLGFEYRLKEIKKDNKTSCYERLRNVGNTDISITCTR